MKATTFFFAILLASGLISSDAQNTWTQKADFSGTGRYLAVAFSIGSKGYFGTGVNFNSLPYEKTDFWEYDPAADTWTQRADFGGGAREYAVGFSIGSKGYIGTGSPITNDFWEYDPTVNTWSQKADFAGGARSGAVGFSIGSKGYLGTGGFANDFWEYNPSTDVWTQKAHFGGSGRIGSVGFSIGGKGYIGTGYNGTATCKDFWAYDPATDSWTQEADFGGTARVVPSGFAIGDKGYIGTGDDGINPDLPHDFWEYNSTSNTWMQVADFGGDARIAAAGFTIGGKGYITNGLKNDYATYFNDLWEYTPCDGIGLTVYADADGDGYGDASKSLIAADCIPPVGYTYSNTDCNDNDAAIHPNACDASNGNGLDDNCDGIIDDGAGTVTYYTDADHDGYGVGTGSPFCVDPGVGYSINNTDCNDADASIHPYAQEIYNGIDDDCNGTVDDYYAECPIPSNLSAGQITTTSAKLKWDAAPIAEGYRVGYKVTGTSDWTKIIVTSASKKITGLLPNTEYSWHVLTICTLDPYFGSNYWSLSKHFTTSPLRMSDESLRHFSFQMNPNPAGAQTFIQLTLPEASHVSMKVYDMSGKEIAMLQNGDMDEGDHSLPFNTTDFQKGVYIIEVIYDGGIENQKLMVQ